MSQIESAAPAESAPASTADIAANVIESAEQEADSTPEPDTELAATVEAQPAEAEPKAEARPKSEASKAAEFLRKLGHDLKRSDGRKAYMPVDTVAKMLDRYIDEHSATWTTERTTYEGRVKEMQDHLEQLRQGIAGDEVAFISEVAKIDPRYQRFLEPPKAAPAAAPIGEMPAPDLPLPDGSRTYSLEGLQKLLEWNTQQVEARLMPKVDERLKPLTDREKQAQERDRMSAAQEQNMAKAKSQMQEAQTWPLFGKIAEDGTLTPFQQEVLTAYRADKSLDLRGAYMKVALPRLTEDDNKKRERIMQEVKRTAPRSPALTPGVTDIPKEQGPVSTADIAAKTLARLERGA